MSETKGHIVISVENEETGKPVDVWNEKVVNHVVKAIEKSLIHAFVAGDEVDSNIDTLVSRGGNYHIGIRLNPRIFEGGER